MTNFFKQFCSLRLFKLKHIYQKGLRNMRLHWEIRSKMLRIIGIAIILGFLLLRGTYEFNPIEYPEKGPVLIRLEDNDQMYFKLPPSPRKITVLFWSTMYGDYKNWKMFFSQKHLKECPYMDCEFTTDRNKLNSSDAVVFSGWRKDLKTGVNLHGVLPPVRNPSQRWIFFSNEATEPVNKEQFTRYNGIFNWTMTYREDSDIYNPYGRIIMKKSANLEPNQNFAEGKTKLAVWIVSHCETRGNREGFVKELRKYMKVDIFGKCGASCTKKRLFNISSLRLDRCVDSFTDYKFYFSFENVLCLDYVSEKLFELLTMDLVPVVFGFGRYDSLLPNHSFIDALSFESPKKLAEYLYFLDGNDEEYNKYFDWKRGFNLTHKGFHSIEGCLLCSKLMNSSLPSKVLDNFNDWWLKNSHCMFWKGKRNLDGNVITQLESLEN